ncbi:MAG: OmpH family outer membrane protein [Bacteroidetes Order II. Incertae sedis bacterium]|nr:OmpH family outer membrane protein [Bacteroidetes Order II. bacterium]
MNHIKKAFFLLVVLLGVSQSPVAAQTPKIGYTEPGLILTQMPEYRLVLQKLDAEYQMSDAEIRLKAQEFQTKLDDYQRKAAFMSDSTKAQTERELTSLQEAVQQMQQDKTQLLRQKESEMLQPLFDKISEAINTVAKEKNLEYVFSTRVSESGPVLLYSKDESADITRAVMEKLGIKVEAATPAANKPASNGNRPAPSGNNKPKN